MEDYELVENRRINYYVLEKYWVEISKRADKGFQNKMYSNSKTGLYEMLGTYSTDFSSHKTGKKIKLTKKMKAVIDNVSFENYEYYDEYKRVVNSWREYIQSVLRGEKVICDKYKEDILKVLNKEATPEETKRISEEIDDYCEGMVERYWHIEHDDKNQKKIGLAGAICIWISLHMAGESNVYLHDNKLVEASERMRRISVEDMNLCRLDKLWGTIEVLEEKLSNMKIVYEYRKLHTKKG